MFIHYNNDEFIIDGKQKIPNLYPNALVQIDSLREKDVVKASLEAKQKYEELKTISSKIADHAQLDFFTFKVAPYAHQVDALLRMIYFDRLALLFEQGLGKTYIALLSLAIKQKMFGKSLKMLVVAPKIVAPNWLREAEKFTDLVGLPLYGDTREREMCKERIRIEPWDFIITTYSILSTNYSNEKNLRCTKKAKLDYWKSAPRHEKDIIINYLKRKQLVTDEELANASTDKQLWDIMKKAGDLLNNKNVFKYQRVYSDIEFLQEQPYNIIVFDEASKVKTRTAACSKAAFALSEKCKQRYLLSGTLCNGSPEDFYAPFTLLDNTLWKNWTEFNKKYLVASNYNRHIVVGYKNLDDLKVKTNPFIFSAKRNDCIDLPERTILTVDVPLDKSLVSLYNEIATTTKPVINVGNYYINTSSVVVKLIKLHQLVSGFLVPLYDDKIGEVCNNCAHVWDCVSNYTKPVYPWSEECKEKTHGITERPQLPNIEFNTTKLERLMEDLEDSTEPTIIWAWYRHDITKIKQLLIKNKIKFVEATSKNCDTIFNTDEAIRVFLGQVSQGIGITLNRATRTIYYSHGMVLEHRLQSMDRNYRIGQQNKVLVLDYVDDKTIEKSILFLLKNKVDVKELLQERPVCFDCPSIITCKPSNIKYLGEGCKYEFDRERAEKKAMIKIRGYGCSG